MLYMWVEALHCVETTDGLGGDEPYLVVFAADLDAPATTHRRYGPFDMSDGDTRPIGFIPFWFNDDERELASPDAAIIIAALMEHDNSSPFSAGASAAAAGASSIARTRGAARDVRVKDAMGRIRRGLKATFTGAPDDDIIDLQELRFTPEDLALAETGRTASQTLAFNGQGGSYTATFGTRMRGQTKWRFCNHCFAMFYQGFTTEFIPRNGVCPGNGGAGHVAQGYRYYLPHDRPASPATEAGWRFCNRCFAMVRPGSGLGSAPGDPGTCPAGAGGHERQGFRFSLPLSTQAPTGQDQWARCGRCRVLFYDGDAHHKGVCPAGGAHARATTLQGAPLEALKLDFEP
ncbi:hypothetical protein [Georgenia faecalis]|uniref:Uncharacterized protein n=1 Tax=Georgenia faecalis TaxID=2483799 RepID=A0ABV9D918_9MICO|nr:hypothetical protein [Georgenia faecalis]